MKKRLSRKTMRMLIVQKSGKSARFDLHWGFGVL